MSAKRNTKPDPIRDVPVPEKVPAKIAPTIETWSVPLKEIYENSDVRLDASHYDRDRALALEELRKCNCELKSLSSIAEVKLPGQFVRIWAKSPEYGLPYVNASELMSLAALGTIGTKTRLLSKITETDIDELVIKEGWLF
jgi:hypothetical protein